MIEETNEQQFDETPQGQAKLWQMEFKSAQGVIEPWWQRASDVVARYRDDRQGATLERHNLNLFPANINTQRAMLYGKTPAVEVSRRFHDAEDDVARVGGEIMERMLNYDIEAGEDGFSDALRQALDDRLLAGLGSVLMRYKAEFEQQETAAIIGQNGEVLAEGFVKQVKTYECIETEYAYWKDQLWSPARTFGEVRWWAFRKPVTREMLVQRFGDIGKLVPLNSKKDYKGVEDIDSQNADPWSRADLWEIWDKDKKRLVWYVEGFNQILDEKPDPLGLRNFWPFPRPMFANLTTSSLIPLPDYCLAQDLYRQVDDMTDRIYQLQQAVNVRGVYDKTATGVRDLMNSTNKNGLFPVDNWAMFAEKGGVRGCVDWLPLEQIVAAMDKLRELRSETMNLLYQVTGMSDIMRGQATNQATATEQAIKAKFASVRMQSFQDEFARFATEAQSIKAELISKFFDPRTIFERSNIQYTPDARFAGPAIQFLKSKYYCYRIDVKPESISLTDYAALKQERTEIIQALGGMMNAIAPLVQMMPQSLPYMLQMAQWMVAGLKGSSQIEGVFDQAIGAAEKAALQPRATNTDTRVEAEKIKVQGDMMHSQMESKNRLQEIMAETQSEIIKQRAQADENIKEVAATERIKALNKINMPGMING